MSGSERERGAETERTERGAGSLDRQQQEAAYHAVRETAVDGIADVMRMFAARRQIRLTVADPEEAARQEAEIDDQVGATLRDLADVLEDLDPDLIDKLVASFNPKP